MVEEIFAIINHLPIGGMVNMKYAIIYASKAEG
jgi:hypothetical protein